MLALAVAAQLLALSLAAGHPILVIGCALALLAVLLPLPLGLGWRACLLLAAACYPLVMLAAAVFGAALGRLPQTLGTGPMPPLAAHTITVTILYLPPLLVPGAAVAKAVSSNGSQIKINTIISNGPWFHRPRPPASRLRG